MGQTNVSIRMDEELKRNFEAFCADVGMSMTTAFCIFAKKAVREYRIPFEVGAERPNEDTLAAMEEVRQMRANLKAGRTYTDVDEMFRDILS